MNDAASRLVARLMAIQLGAWLLTGWVVVVFAPRLLLLADAVVDASAWLVLWAWAAEFALVLVSTVIVTRRLRPLLRRLALGSTLVAPSEVLRLYSAPVRLVALDLAGTLVIGLATLIRPLRPAPNSVSTQFEIVLLAMTIASVAVLPAYVMMRASVGKVLELVPVTAAREALAALATSPRRILRVRHRLLAAVVAPVAFVALGASLLVHAHLRAFEATSRQNAAAEVAQGVFDAVDGDARGRAQAIETARQHGFDIAISPTSQLFSVSGSVDGETFVTVLLSDGAAVVRLAHPRLSLWTGAYVGLAFIAVLAAVVLGYRTGRAFAADVVLATQGLEATGVAGLLRGEHIRGDARFDSVAALMQAADELGGVFREFASAQQRAIDARASTERTRGLFLASMSHDLKAPLNAILGFGALVSQGELTGDQRQSVAIIERRGRELLYLIDTILDAARVEAGQLTVSPLLSSLGDVVMHAVHKARELTDGARLPIVGEVQPDLPLVRVDPVRLAQGLTAIILVACRLAERGHVIVRVAMGPGGSHLRIGIEVTGRATADPDREKVFEAFRHADRVRRHGSLGLGPSLARAIVELHGGAVAIETNETGGTLFHVSIPFDRISAVPTDRISSRIL